LLPEPERILKEISNTISDNGTLFVIVPNTEGLNFLWFEAHHKGINKLILKEKDLQSYFNVHGWVLAEKVPLIFAHTFGRNYLIACSPLSPFILRILN